jgi:excisionase family DNA binding protein
MTNLEISKKLLTINEAASALGLGRSLIYTLIAKGELKSIKIGRARRIPLSAIDEFIKQHLEQDWSKAEGRP